MKVLKYAIVVGFVIGLPLTVLDVVGQGQPWYCKYICPSGTLLGGIPLIAANPMLRSALSWLFAWKVGILVVLLLLSVVVYRPFCRYVCPLGAVYGLFNPIALYRYRVMKPPVPTAEPVRRPAPWTSRWRKPLTAPSVSVVESAAAPAPMGPSS